MFLLNELRKFQTKRRSSDGATWVAWAAILSASIVMTSVLALTQVQLMSKKDVRFFNVRAATLDDFRPPSEPREESANLDARTPVFFLGREKVLLGAASGVVAPRPDGDVVVLDAKTWRSQVVSAVKGWKRAREVFPSRVVAIAAPWDGSMTDAAEVFGSVVSAVTEINNLLSPGEPFGAPVPVMVSVKSKMLASGETSGGH